MTNLSHLATATSAIFSLITAKNKKPLIPKDTPMKQSRTNNFTLTAIAAVLSLCFGAGSIAQAAVITPTSATATSDFFGDARSSVNNIINSNGFTQNVPIETSTHNNTDWDIVGSDEGWFYDEGADSTPDIDFDLGGTFDIGTAHIWNYNGVSNTLNWGSGNIQLTFSRNGATFEEGDDTTQTLTLAQASGLATYTGEHFALTTEASVTHIRLTVLSALPGGNFIGGLSEVRFSEAGSVVPEPSTCVLLLVSGFAAACVATFRRRRS